MKKFTMAMMSVMTLGLLAACGSTGDQAPEQAGTAPETTENSDNVWVVGTSADYYPFEFIDETTNEIVGFDIDLINHIAAELGYTVEMVDMDFGSLIPALQAGRVDLVISGMTPTEERAQVVDFSNVYHRSQEILLTTEDHDITSLDDLNGLRIGVQSTTIQEAKAEDLVADGFDIEIESLNRIPELVQQLLNGRVDGIIMDGAVVNNYLRIHDHLVALDNLFEVDNDGSAIALPLNSDLTARINEVLAQMEADGTKEELVYKWFGN